jgi:hypothetical protein
MLIKYPAYSGGISMARGGRTKLFGAAISTTFAYHTVSETATHRPGFSGRNHSSGVSFAVRYMVTRSDRMEGFSTLESVFLQPPGFKLYLPLVQLSLQTRQFSTFASADYPYFAFTEYISVSSQ